jgi:hypothetical protein
VSQGIGGELQDAEFSRPRFENEEERSIFMKFESVVGLAGGLNNSNIPINNRRTTSNITMMSPT